MIGEMGVRNGAGCMGKGERRWAAHLAVNKARPQTPFENLLFGGVIWEVASPTA